MITVTTTSTGEDLTTVAAVKEAIGLVGTSDDVYLGALVTRASQAIARYCGVTTLMRESLVETVPGYGGALLQLARTPIRSVSSVTLRGEAITDYVVEDAEAGWLYRERGWEWTRSINWSLTDRVVSGGELPLFSVTYQAGLLLASSASSEGRTVPSDLEQATIETVKDWRANRAANPSLASRRIGPLAVEYRGPSLGITPEALPSVARALCQPYRRNPVAA